MLVSQGFYLLSESVGESALFLAFASQSVELRSESVSESALLLTFASQSVEFRSQGLPKGLLSAALRCQFALQCADGLGAS
jgi:hypothetical protein